jgi:hypothetical protein
MFGYTSGKAFAGDIPVATNLNSGDDTLKSPTDGDSPFMKELAL